ncbi:MAG: alkaline phosphatase family protein, partial [Clostridia bacterium]|nr:alkaline phosphatase family protein [Clostridia bacterium]
NKAFNAMFSQDNAITDVEKYIKSQHDSGINDQDIEPRAVKSSEFKGVDKNDCILFFNFREDRLRQIVKKCEELKCSLITMADVGGVKAKSLYPNKITKNTLSEYLSKNNVYQVKISETTKYAHVTYFLNGGEEKAFKGEDRVHIPTIPTQDYAQTPHMQAKNITKQAINSIKKGYDAIIVNFSNADMIGHTGNYSATVKALECVDKCVKKILKFAKKNKYFVIITADHGNAEEMVNEAGEVNTAHSINPVFCVAVDGDKTHEMKRDGTLKDVAPTFVELLDLKPCKYFEGESLILK